MPAVTARRATAKRETAVLDRKFAMERTKRSELKASRFKTRISRRRACSS